MTEQEILALQFECGDLNRELSIREYLLTLLTELWEREEMFNGKRPFGNSGWQGDLAEPLVRAGVIKGTIDDDPDCWDIDYDTDELRAVIARCIKAI